LPFLSSEAALFEEVRARLRDLARSGDPDVLLETRMGLEKESLRVAASGGIARTPHPAAWGAPLTHAWLTTDYSEALSEFITPPCLDAGEALDFLADMQSYAYRRLTGEVLWATSMPCVLAGEDSIPIAEYGNSNMGRMKHVYRVGLGYRYGRVMQVIAGVHFNWSLPESFWPRYAQVLDNGLAPDALRDQQYMALIRNMLRTGWLIPYLFGASPAVCKSFFEGGRSRLPAFDDHTFYEPYATSLRMGDIGYQNSREAGLGIRACYHDVDSYADSLLHAITTPAAAWEKIGVKVDGEYRQLNANILQIENEYYSSVRPKQLLQGLESPAVALHKRGVRYIELRSLDVNAYHPLGVDEMQLRFLETWMLACLLADSPLLSDAEQRAHNQNLLDVAHRGREPGLELNRDGEPARLRDWGQEILHALLPVAEYLDRVHGCNDFEDALDEQLNKILHPDLTPSARMLHEMRSNGESFYHFAHRLSLQHHRYFSNRGLSAAQTQEFDQMVEQSFADQARIEAQEQGDFDRFLQDYFAQTYAALQRR
jgi:glutamate--cysteine ligase